MLGEHHGLGFPRFHEYFMYVRQVLNLLCAVVSKYFRGGASHWLRLPAHCLTFTMVPIHWRVPWIAGVGLVWLTFLSSFRGSEVLRKSN